MLVVQVLVCDAGSSGLFLDLRGRLGFFGSRAVWTSTDVELFCRVLKREAVLENSVLHGIFPKGFGENGAL